MHIDDVITDENDAHDENAILPVYIECHKCKKEVLFRVTISEALEGRIKRKCPVCGISLDQINYLLKGQAEKLMVDMSKKEADKTTTVARQAKNKKALVNNKRSSGR
jgi:hypothetical protein